VFAVGINDHVLWRALHSRLIGTLVTDDFVSCPLGLFTERDGKDQLVPVGGIAAFSNARRLELVEESSRSPSTRWRASASGTP